MERRVYFLCGDLVSCAVIGAAAGGLCAVVFGPAWNMILAMIVGMVLGMALSLVLGFALFFWLFGAMEVMVPAMLTGMAAGMAISMAAAMDPVGAAQAAQAGALIGLAVVGVTYVANARLVGKVSEWTS